MLVQCQIDDMTHADRRQTGRIGLLKAAGGGDPLVHAHEIADVLGIGHRASL